MKQKKRKWLAIAVCIIMLLGMFPTAVFAEDTLADTLSTEEQGIDTYKPGGNLYGDWYDHIDVKVDGKYSITVDGEPYSLKGELQGNSIKVTIGTSTYDFSKYFVKEQMEKGKKEYEIKVDGLSPSSIAWVSGTYNMTNVYVSAKMLFETVPDVLKNILPTTTIGGTTYYYADINNMQYSGVQECTGGKGMRSDKNTGTPTGLDLYITAEDAGVHITKGKLAIKKTIVNEAGKPLENDKTEFTFEIVGTDDATKDYQKTVSIKGGETKVLTELKAGTYRITEKQKNGYVIRTINGKDANNNYTVDYTVVSKNDEEIPVAIFTNTKLEEKTAIAIKKIATGALEQEKTYPNPEISIYDTANGEKVEPAIWSGTLTANSADAIYPNVYLEKDHTYIVEESNAGIDGYNCTTALSVDGSVVNGMTFTVAEKAKTISLLVNNTYEKKEAPVETGSLTITKNILGRYETDLPDNYNPKFRITGPNGYNETIDWVGMGTLSTTKTKTIADLKPGEYTVEEIADTAKIPGYTVKTESDKNDNKVTVPANGTATITITNTYAPETVTISGTKTWVDNGEKHPQIITINLYADGVYVGQQETYATKDWKYSFTGLQKYNNGKEIEYTIQETPIENYTPKYTKTDEGWDITNTYKSSEIVPDEGWLQLTKVIKGFDTLPEGYKIAFTIVAPDKTQRTVEYGGNGWIDSNKVIAGEYTITETVTIPDDKYTCSTTYLVKTDEAKPMSSDADQGVQPISGKTAKVTVAKNKITRVEFTNTYTKNDDGYVPTPSPTSYPLTITKQVVGLDTVPADYAVTVNITNKYGTVFGTLTLKANEPKTIYLSYGEYTLTEVAPAVEGYTLSGQTFSENNFVLNSTVGKNVTVTNTYTKDAEEPAVDPTPADPTTPDEPNTPDENSNNVPKTGDNMPISLAIYGIIAAAALLGIRKATKRETK